jgi:hypothetical protein
MASSKYAASVNIQQVNTISTAIWRSEIIQSLIFDPVIEFTDYNEGGQPYISRQTFFDICAVGVFGEKTWRLRNPNVLSKNQGFFIVNGQIDFITGKSTDDLQTHQMFFTNLSDDNRNARVSGIFQIGLNIIRLLRTLMQKTMKLYFETLLKYGTIETSEYSSFIDDFKGSTTILSVLQKAIDNLPRVNNGTDKKVLFNSDGKIMYMSFDRYNKDFVALAENDSDFDPDEADRNILQPKALFTLCRQERKYAKAYTDFKLKISDYDIPVVNSPSPTEKALSWLPPEIFRDYPHALKNDANYNPTQFIRRYSPKFNDKFVFNEEVTVEENSTDKEKLISTLQNFDTIEKELDTKITSLQGIEVSDELKDIVKAGIIDITHSGPITSLWKKTVSESEKSTLYDSNNYLSIKLNDWMSPVDDTVKNALFASDKIVVAGIPYHYGNKDFKIQFSSLENDGTMTYVSNQTDSLQEFSSSGTAVSYYNEDDQSELKKLLFLFYGIDFSVDQFPINPNVLKPSFPEILQKAEDPERWPWAEVNFEDNYPESMVDPKYYCSPFMFSEWSVNKALASKLFQEIRVYLVKTDLNVQEIIVGEVTGV